MLNKFKALGLAATIAALSPIAAWAAPITGDLEIGTTLDLAASTFADDGRVALAADASSIVLDATGSFDAAGLSLGDSVLLGSFDLTAPVSIWSVGIFTFEATAFSNISETVSGAEITRSFNASGVVSAAGFDDTIGLLSFSGTSSSQKTTDVVSFNFTTDVAPVPLPAGLLLMGTALAGLGMVRRKKA